MAAARPCLEVNHPCGPQGQQMIQWARERQTREARETITRLREQARVRMEEGAFEGELERRR